MNSSNSVKFLTVENIFLLATVAVSYLLGAIPSGLVLTRLAGLGDIRKIGSGNIGATNVLRPGNKPLAAATLVADILKGALGVWVGWWIAGGDAGIAGFNAGHLAGLAAFLGHLYPVWIGFKGGKGVATYIGVLAGLLWPAALLFCGVWLTTAAVFRYSSLSALVAAVVVPVFALLQADMATALLFLCLSVLMLARHHANISRLIVGQEPKIGAKS